MGILVINTDRSTAHTLTLASASERYTLDAAGFDDRTVLKVDRLWKGIYEYTYYARATTTGDFFVAPSHAEEQFFPEVFNTSPPAAGSVHTVGRFDDVFLHIVAPCSQLE